MRLQAFGLYVRSPWTARKSPKPMQNNENNSFFWKIWFYIRSAVFPLCGTPFFGAIRWNVEFHWYSIFAAPSVIVAAPSTQLDFHDWMVCTFFLKQHQTGWANLSIPITNATHGGEVVLMPKCSALLQQGDNIKMHMQQNKRKMNTQEYSVKLELSERPWLALSL